MFTNRVREIRNTVANHNRYRAVRKTMSNPHYYPAAALAIAAAGIGVAPVAASAHSAPAKPATVAAAPAGPATSTHPAAPAAKPASAPAKPAPAKPAPVAAKPAKPANVWAGTGIGQLEPNGTDGAQSHISLDSDQWANATSIVKATQNLHLSPYAATIAVATSMQESKLQNLNVAVDHDSLGLFQQRPSTGWGTPNELENPNYAATAFLKSLPANYQNLQLDDAAQQVQRSFDGQLYAQWEDQASHIVYSIVNS